MDHGNSLGEMGGGLIKEFSIPDVQLTGEKKENKQPDQTAGSPESMIKSGWYLRR